MESKSHMADLSLDEDFGDYGSPVLYLTYGNRFDEVELLQPAFYVGITKRSLRKRTQEHISGIRDRKFRFEAEGNLAWRLPSDWGSGSGFGELSLAENMVLHSLNSSLHEAGGWLDNKSYIHRLRGVSESSSHTVRSFLVDTVAPSIEECFNLDLRIPTDAIEPSPYVGVHSLTHSAVAKARAAANGWI